MSRTILLTALISLAFLLETPVFAQAPGVATPSFNYPRREADAPVVAVLQIDQARRVEGPVGDEVRRYYVEATISRLIRAPAALPPRVRLLIDVRRESNGRWPKLKGQSVLVAARRQGADALQLIDPAAVRPATPQLVAEAERFAVEALAPEAPTPVTGITQVASVPGNLPGERETQIFLSTSSGRPASLSIVRRPNQAPRWSASFSDIAAVDAVPPARDSLAWFRLSCSLPEMLPEGVLAPLGAAEQSAAREDFLFVREQLGACS